MNILVTGGTGYIGSHTCIELLNDGHNVIIIDNLYNSSKNVVPVIENLTNKNVTFYPYDLCNKELIYQIFSNHNIDAVIHFAGLKAVGESVSLPLKYYYNNIYSTLNLCEVMQEFGVKKIIFSSSATIYGEINSSNAITEDMGIGKTTNPYARCKAFIEQILSDLYVSDNSWEITILRYFNPTGAHPSGDLGEDPNGLPNNLMPYISRVAVGKLDCIRVFGNDYPTPDGTGMRDYIHVVDLAKGHVMALNKLNNKNGVNFYNLGTGVASSVLDVIHCYEKACGFNLPYNIVERRPGDIAIAYANCDKAYNELGWKAQYNLEQMCIDNFKWQSKHPNGFNE